MGLGVSGAVAAALLVGLLAVSAQDDEFLAALRDAGISTASADAAVEAGHLVCKELDEGFSRKGVAMALIWGAPHLPP